MKNKVHILTLMLAVLLLTGCNLIDDTVVDDDTPVEVSLCLSRYSGQQRNTTRQSNTVVQEGFVREILVQRIIPFAKNGKVESGDMPKFSSIGGLTTYDKPKNTTPPNSRFYYYDKCSFMSGVSAFLVYGKAEPVSGGDAVNGALDADFPADQSPANIKFSPKQICTTTNIHDDAQAIADYLTTIANTDGWATTSDSHLQAYYLNFIGKGSVAPSVIAGSSANVKAYVADLKNRITAEPESSLRTKILESIDFLNIDTHIPANYPGSISLPDGTSISLPDGAARVQWNASGSELNSFTDITGNYGNGNTIDITKYTYPAALWYYVNTPLKASTEKESDDYDTAGDWDGVINGVYAGAASVVDADTKSVALTNPVQYGVGRLETAIRMGDGTFYDRNGEVVVTGDYKLIGVLIGGQSRANWDFTQRGDDNLTIYDRVMAHDVVARPNSVTAQVNQTLALETKKDQKIYVALELLNGGEDFQGADGIIPAGGTFYMTAVLDPKKASNYDESNRNKIFIQDHVTQLTVTIRNGKSKDDPTYDPENPDGGGLGEATNGIPDLTSPGIEVGTSVDLQWRQGLIINPSI